jgi:ELWxxDGT repeat protein
MVKDIYDSWDKLPGNLTNVNGTLFFTHTNGIDGEELWMSDGSADGTVMVKDIAVGAGDSSPQNLAAFGDLLVFSAFDPVNGREPWISDGTDGGTVMLKDINTDGNSNPRWFEESGGMLFFSADDGDIGKELWISDGTTLGTELVKDISPEGAGINRGSDPYQLTDVNGTLYFGARNSVGEQVANGEELWKSDGTEGGTVMVKDISPGSDASNPRDLTNLSGTLLFVAITPEQGTWGGELWRSDGTDPGTYMVKDTFPNPNPINYWPARLMTIGGALMFVADDSFNGRQLWFSDGTEDETFMIDDQLAGDYWSSPFWLTDAAGTLFFRANDGTNGTEIWALTEPATCHLLALDHTGLGADPVADPTSSDGCDEGLYEEGEVVTLTANPEPEWTVSGWIGSDDDGSTASINSVTMPDDSHTVTVEYSGPPFIFGDGFEPGGT